MSARENSIEPGRGTLMFKSGRREAGRPQPGIKTGPFTIRIPLIHHQLEVSELFQGIIMTATGLGLVALLEDLFGIPYEIALTIIIVQQLGYYLHQFLGDITVTGWITPAVPLIMSFIARYPEGADRLRAYMAIQIVVGILFIVFGASGLASGIIRKIPASLKAGLIIGAGLSVLTGDYGITPSGLLYNDYFFVLVIGIPLVLVLVYSDRIKVLIRNKPRGFFARISKYGIVPGLLLVMIIAAVSGEASLSKIEFGFFIPRFGEMVEGWSLFAVGPPTLEMFLSSIPVAFAAYIMALGGTVLQAETAEEAAQHRPDEDMGFDSGRLSLITGIRNLIHGVLAPNGGLAGPNWAAMNMLIARRYEQGKDAMYSFIGASASFNMIRVIMMTFLPLITFILPFRVPILCVVMMLQGFACFSMGLKIADSRMRRSVAVLIAVILAYYGASRAILLGVVLSLAMESRTQPG